MGVAHDAKTFGESLIDDISQWPWYYQCTAALFCLFCCAFIKNCCLVRRYRRQRDELALQIEEKDSNLQWIMSNCKDRNVYKDTSHDSIEKGLQSASPAASVLEDRQLQIQRAKMQHLTSNLEAFLQNAQHLTEKNNESYKAALRDEISKKKQELHKIHSTDNCDCNSLKRLLNQSNREMDQIKLELQALQTSRIQPNITNDLRSVLMGVNDLQRQIQSNNKEVHQMKRLLHSCQRTGREPCLIGEKFVDAKNMMHEYTLPEYEQGERTSQLKQGNQRDERIEMLTEQLQTSLEAGRALDMMKQELQNVKQVLPYCDSASLGEILDEVPEMQDLSGADIRNESHVRRR